MFSLPATDGMTVESGQIKDPVLVVIFTCNHCPYAQAYEGRIRDLIDDFHQEGAQFVIISSNDAENYPADSFENMKEKQKEAAWAAPYCYDEDQSVAKAFGALCTPHCFVFDSERTLQYKGRIDDSWEDESVVTESNLHNAVRALIDGDDVPNQEEHAIGCSIKWK